MAAAFRPAASHSNKDFCLHSPADSDSAGSHFSSLHAANALLNLSRTPCSHYATAASSVAELISVTSLTRVRPTHDESSEGFWEHYRKSISPVQRTWSPGQPHPYYVDRCVSAVPGSQVSTSCAHDLSPISPPSDILSFSSGSVSEALATTPTAPRSGASTSGQSNEHTVTPLTQDDGERFTEQPTVQEVEDYFSHLLPRRTFPANVPINEEFPLFYRRFSVPSHTGIQEKQYVPYSYE